MSGVPVEDLPRVLRLPTGETITIVASGRDTRGALFEVDALLPPRLAGPPRHRHRRQTETFAVVEGRMRVMIGSETIVLSAGDSATVPPTVAHAFANPFDETARIPGGRSRRDAGVRPAGAAGTTGARPRPRAGAGCYRAAPGQATPDRAGSAVPGRQRQTEPEAVRAPAEPQHGLDRDER